MDMVLNSDHPEEGSLAFVGGMRSRKMLTPTNEASQLNQSSHQRQISLACLRSHSLESFTADVSFRSSASFRSSRHRRESRRQSIGAARKIIRAGACGERTQEPGGDPVRRSLLLFVWSQHPSIVGPRARVPARRKRMKTQRSAVGWVAGKYSCQRQKAQKLVATVRI